MKLYRLALVVCLCTFISAQSSSAIRAAIDIGAGGPKLRVAEIDLATDKIINILCTKQYPVIFQQCLSRSGDKRLSSEVMAAGVNAVKEAIAVAKSLEAEGVVLIGASIFRNAVNGEELVRLIYEETGLEVHLLDQELEGRLAFAAAHAKIGVDSQNLVIWDIGGGSTQLIGTHPDGLYFVDGSDEGSGPFRDFIIEQIQGRNLKEHKSPNPLSQEEAQLAESHAFSLAAKVNRVFRDKLCDPITEIAGVGSVFSRGIAPLVEGKNPFNVEDLEEAVRGLVGKTDADLGGGDFACIEVSNPILALGFMKGLGIQQMRIVDVNNADGAMVYKPFWSSCF